MQSRLFAAVFTTQATNQSVSHPICYSVISTQSTWSIQTINQTLSHRFVHRIKNTKTDSCSCYFCEQERWQPWNKPFLLNVISLNCSTFLCKKYVATFIEFSFCVWFWVCVIMFECVCACWCVLYYFGLNSAFHNLPVEQGKQLALRAFFLFASSFVCCLFNFVQSVLCGHATNTFSI